VGGIPEVVVEGETGLLVPPGNARQLARALAGLLRNPDQGQRLGQAGQERARQHFGLERMIGELQRLYEELLAARGSMR
jgi:glycosyltransferase involved in cell wall biosynthesis